MMMTSRFSLTNYRNDNKVFRIDYSEVLCAALSHLRDTVSEVCTRWNVIMDHRV